MRWDWLPTYMPELVHGLLITLLVVGVSVVLGFALAVVLGLAQVRGGFISKLISRSFCSYIRGTPLLMQLYLLYYGIGSLFPLILGVREHFQWLVRLDALYYVLAAFTLSFAGYEGEIMRGAFLAVPRGELEAAEAIGMSRWQILRQVWLPSAIYKILPTLTGEVIGQLKSTPLTFTVPVMDLMGAAHRVMQDTYLIYEPLLIVAVVYLLITWAITSVFSQFERRLPVRRMAYVLPER